MLQLTRLRAANILKWLVPALLSVLLATAIGCFRDPEPPVADRPVEVVKDVPLAENFARAC